MADNEISFEYGGSAFRVSASGTSTSPHRVSVFMDCPGCAENNRGGVVWLGSVSTRRNGCGKTIMRKARKGARRRRRCYHCRSTQAGAVEKARAELTPLLPAEARPTTGGA